MVDWESARRAMIEHQLRGRGIRDPLVLAAMATLPREQFLDPDQRDFAYEDRALPTAFGQTISQPYVVARMTEVLEVQPGMKVLEIGTGTGYQAAVLLTIGVRLWTIERIAELSLASSLRLESLGFTDVHLIIGDGSIGYPQEAPFERIIVTAAAPAVPKALLDQLGNEGILVAPVGGPDDQVVVRVEKHERRIVEQPVFPCRFVKLLGKEGWNP